MKSFFFWTNFKTLRDTELTALMVFYLQRNAATIARAQSLRDADQNKRREELQKRIEQTRLKLQNIGYQSMLKGSQSISDLTSHLPTDRFNPNSRPESAMSDFHTIVNNRAACKYLKKSILFFNF